jgi:uncharacterized protein with von Willebrand factor type A (vWA) domain
MNDKTKPENKVGGVLHTYTKYDPVKFPSPTQPPPDIVSPLMDQMMSWGSARQLTEEELANAIRLDPEQFKNLGPSLDLIKAMLEERKRKILETYETKTVRYKAKQAFRKRAKGFAGIPKEMRAAYKEAVAREQLYDLENLWYRAGDDASDLARHLMGLMGNLGDKYQIDELASRWHFTGHESMTIPQALEIKEELEKIEELLEQVEQAAETAQIAILDMDQLGEFMDDETMHSLEEMKKQIDEYVEQIAAEQGLSKKDGRYELTPQAVRTFQGKLLTRIFSHLKESNTGRHQANVQGEGAVELQQTKPYEFGDSITQMDIPQTFINALIRDSSQSPIRLKSDDIEIHRTRNNPKAATVIVMDMSGSMRYDGQYINVKRMAMAMDALIRSEYPGDYLNFIEMYTFGKLRRQGEIIELMPKPVTIHDPFVQLKVDMSRPEVSEHMVHQHFTNIQHSLKLARTLLSTQNTPNRQVMLITDGLPTAHFEGSTLYMLYPPHRVTEDATMREAMLCAQEGITINTFLVPSWSQSEEDIRFAHRLSESTKGRVFFTAGGDLDRFVVWDYIQGKREII